MALQPEPEGRLRPVSNLATRGVLAGLVTLSVLLGSIEQAWLYQHLSLLELGLRILYLLLPWAGAWLLARVGRDRVVLTTLGALLGELFSEALSLVASGASALTVAFHLMLPLANLPVVMIGLALAVFGPRRPLWQLAIALPLAQLLSRAATLQITSPGAPLSGHAALLAGLAGLLGAATVWLFRRPTDAPTPPAPDAEGIPKTA